jgi:hypothetical protein
VCSSDKEDWNRNNGEVCQVSPCTMPGKGLENLKETLGPGVDGSA